MTFAKILGIALQQSLSATHFLELPNENQSLNRFLLRAVVLERNARWQLVVGIEPVVQKNASSVRDAFVSASNPHFDCLPQRGTQDAVRSFDATSKSAALFF